ncbi:hypothetical protein F3Y22_tig00110634pilonHSYRG00104 [Hibiscus syriacus]|uniref:Subtilisin-like protease fibronectin type-III domain-containing protein n=1 Tax=Hibiscus syriacus TaxID=106335 RepID=A0A6A2ZYX5_HIBSY|nr:hypothetical protein F3Y22_tig00110634pilonHSYRG00104 [Hibiscus syriacus]
MQGEMAKHISSHFIGMFACFNVLRSRLPQRSGLFMAVLIFPVSRWDQIVRQQPQRPHFLNPFDATLLAAIKAGVFVAQAAGNGGYQDYLGFLCTTPGIDVHEIKKNTNSPCNTTIGRPSNFNTPSITISHLVGTQIVTRTVTNVAEEETYVITARMHPSIAIETRPSAMTLRPGASRKFSVTLTARSATGSYSFGSITMKGS